MGPGTCTVVDGVTLAAAEAAAAAHAIPATAASAPSAAAPGDASFYDDATLSALAELEKSHSTPAAAVGMSAMAMNAQHQQLQRQPPLPLPNWALSAASMPVATEFRASTSAAAFNKGAAFSWSFWAEPLLLLLLLL